MNSNPSGVGSGPSEAKEATADHFVQFYEEDAYLVQSVTDFVAHALTTGDIALVVATAAHRQEIEESLSERGLDVEEAKSTRSLVVLDASQTLDQFIVDGKIDPERFQEVVASQVRALASGGRRLKAFGEMVAILAARDEVDTALELECLWSELTHAHPFTIFCAYPMKALGGVGRATLFDRICQTHTHVIPCESYIPSPTDSNEQRRAIAVLQHKAACLEKEISDRKNDEVMLREQTRTLEILHRVASSLVAELELDRVVSIVTDAGRELSGAAFGAFFYNVYGPKGESYLLYTLSGAARSDFERFPMPRNTAIFKPTFDGVGVVRFDDVTKDPKFGQNPPYNGMPKGHLPVRSYLAVPVKSHGGEVLGGLFFGHPEPGVFTDNCEQVLVTLAAQAAVAIENAHLQGALQRELDSAKRAEEVTRLLAAIVESSEDAIIGKDLEGLITSWNKSAERIFGYTEGEIVGQPGAILFPEGHLDEETGILEKIRRGEAVSHYETVRKTKDQSLIDLSLTVSPIYDASGKIVGSSKIARDISERKRHQEELARTAAELAAAKEELETRVQERTASLRGAIAQMEEFSYTVSHDLRAPLRAMRVYSNALLEDFGALLAAEPEAVRYVRKISENSSRLDRMIQDVLTYGRMAREEFTLEPVSLDKLVGELLPHYPALQASHADVSVGELGMVMGHESSLVQIFSNLLDNAVKFVAAGTRPAIEIWTEPDGEFVRIWVKDNGIGIDPTYQHRLFSMFERIHPNLPYEGTGVGLAIVRKAADRMGGKVGVISDGKNGSRFWVQLHRVEGTP